MPLVLNMPGFWIYKSSEYEIVNSQLNLIIIDYLLILAKVTPKKYLVAVLISKWF